MKYLWIMLGWSSVVLAIAGAFLPLLPTTPFLLLAAYAFSRGSKKLHDWLLNHPRLGPPIRNWLINRAISRRVKIYASVSMIALFGLSLMFTIPWWALAGQAGILITVAAFLWTRNEVPAAGTRGANENSVSAG